VHRAPRLCYERHRNGDHGRVEKSTNRLRAFLAFLRIRQTPLGLGCNDLFIVRRPDEAAIPGSWWSVLKRFLNVTTGLALAATSMMFAAGSASAALPATAQTTPSVSLTPGAYKTLPPFRLLDTRAGVGAAKAAVAAGGTVQLQVSGRGGVPVSGVSAVVLNLTVTKSTRSGYLDVFRGGTTRPGTSNLNFARYATASNLAIVAIGTTGNVDLYNKSRGTIELIADVSGYYVSGTPTVPALPGTYVPVVPSRLLDTRAGVGAHRGAVPARGTVHLQVTGRGGIPLSGVAAVALNVTTTDEKSAGYLSVYGDGATRPGTSCLNFVKAQPAANLVIARVGTGGIVSLYNSSFGAIQLVADVSGFYSPGSPTVAGVRSFGLAPSGYFESLVPARLLDTRTGVGVTRGAVAPGATVALQVNGRDGVQASEVMAVALSVTVTEPARSGEVTVYGAGSARPVISNLNFLAGQTVANLTISPVGTGGVVDFYNGSAAPVQLVADTWGYYYIGSSCTSSPSSSVVAAC
jgi:hypothetical protein